MSGFVWYSFGSDKTGPILAEALGFQSGKKTPNFDEYDVVIGWGCKPGTKYNSETLAQLIAQNQVRILNHPDAVDANRDKLGTLNKLKEQGVPVPGFLEFNPGQSKSAAKNVIPTALQEGVVTFPLVLLTRFNRGEPAFCYTIEDVEAALVGNTKKENPFCYVRTFDQGDEYRLHVFRDTILGAQKKSMPEDPIIATTKGLLEKFRKIAKRNDVRVDEKTASLFANMTARELVSSSSQLKKSTGRGWKWTEWNMDLVPVEAATLAIDALDAARLDLGAVSISHVDGTARVLSITTAPALTEEHMGLYVSEIHDFASNDGKVKNQDAKKAIQRKKMASPELISKLYRRLRNLSEDKAEEVLQSLEE